MCPYFYFIFFVAQTKDVSASGVTFRRNARGSSSVGKENSKKPGGNLANVRGGEKTLTCDLSFLSLLFFLFGDAVVTVRHYGSGLDTEWTYSGQASPRPADSTGSVTAWGGARSRKRKHWHGGPVSG